MFRLLLHFLRETPMEEVELAWRFLIMWSKMSLMPCNIAPEYVSGSCNMSASSDKYPLIIGYKVGLTLAHTSQALGHILGTYIFLG